MKMNKPTILTLSAALASMALAAQAAEQSFVTQPLAKGYMVAAADSKVSEGKCGEGKCGGMMAKPSKKKNQPASKIKPKATPEQADKTKELKGMGDSK